MKAYAEQFYKSKTWQATREAYSKSKGCLCENCLEHGQIKPGEIVHHIKPITEANIKNPEITLSWDNLRLLCRACHEEVHRHREKRYTIDEHGHVYPNGK